MTAHTVGRRGVETVIAEEPTGSICGQNLAVKKGADINGKLCVIGANLDEAGVAALFGV